MTEQLPTTQATQSLSSVGLRADRGEGKEGAFSSRSVIAPPAEGRNGGGRIIRVGNTTFIRLWALLFR